jgi:tripartite-type tricarboxylate transporter receptor subunit TctC
MKSKIVMTAVSMLAFAAGAQAAQRPLAEDAAKNYPARPIRVIVPQAPGGSNDIWARYIGAQLSERLGRTVVVDNRPGAEGMIGTEIVARANPDGYTLLMASTAFVMNPAVIRKLPCDPIKDFDGQRHSARHRS